MFFFFSPQDLFKGAATVGDEVCNWAIFWLTSFLDAAVKLANYLVCIPTVHNKMGTLQDDNLSQTLHNPNQTAGLSSSETLDGISPEN